MTLLLSNRILQKSGIRKRTVISPRMKSLKAMQKKFGGSAETAEMFGKRHLMHEREEAARTAATM